MDTIGEANLQQLLQAKEYASLVEATQGWASDSSGVSAKYQGLGMLGMGNHQAAVGPLQMAAQLFPQDQVVLFACGRALMLDGRLEEAKAGFDGLIALNPTHPGALQAIQQLCVTLANRDEAGDPMAAVTWLYRAWELKRDDLALSARILEIYVRNGWSQGALDFVAMLSPGVQNQPKIRQLRQQIQQPVAAPAPSAPAFEVCPFCKQQVIIGATTCPHCKMQIRASAFSGGSYKPEWQGVALNVICVLIILLNVVTMIMVMSDVKTVSKGPGLGTGSLGVGWNLLILFRVEWAMSIAKVWYIVMAMLNGCCGAMALGMMGSADGAPILAVIILFSCGLNAFMAYLVSYEDA